MWCVAQTMTWLIWLKVFPLDFGSKCVRLALPPRPCQVTTWRSRPGPAKSRLGTPPRPRQVSTWRSRPGHAKSQLGAPSQAPPSHNLALPPRPRQVTTWRSRPAPPSHNLALPTRPRQVTTWHHPKSDEQTKSDLSSVGLAMCLTPSVEPPAR